MMNIYQRFSDLQIALREWYRSGRKGTAPRKVRANSSETKQLSRECRVKRDRKRDKLTKKLQRIRLSRGQNIRTGY